MAAASDRGRPANLQALQARIRNLVVKGTDHPMLENRLRRALANTVVGQMLPPGVVKGGTAMKLRIGEAGSRFTPDLDAARAADIPLEVYLDELEARLRSGWQGFTGLLVTLDGPQPVGVPPEYVMQPFEVKLSYESRSWLTVKFELGRDEIGSTRAPELALPDDIAKAFVALGFQAPEPIPVLPVAHQIAQKLHACTGVTRDGTNDRAHDLVDLQLLAELAPFDLVETARTCERLFAARRSHSWPPVVQSYASWPDIYAEAANGLGVLPTVEQAVAWVAELIDSLVRAGETG